MKRLLLLSLLLVGVAIAFCPTGSAEEAAPAAIQAAATPAPAPLGQAGALKTVDVVTLTSGKQVKGRIIAEGSKAVVMIVEEGGKVEERSIPRTSIAKIEKGRKEAIEDYYQTGAVDGKEKVTQKKDPSAATPAPAPTGTTGRAPSASTPQPGRTALPVVTPGSTARPVTSTASTALTVNSPADKLHELFMKDKGYAGLVKIISVEKALELIEKSRKSSHFTRMLESMNTSGTIRSRDLIDFFNRGNVKLEEETLKKARRYLTDLAFSPRQ
jgi:hypothetical protein